MLLVGCQSLRKSDLRTIDYLLLDDFVVVALFLNSHRGRSFIRQPRPMGVQSTLGVESLDLLFKVVDFT